MSQLPPEIPVFFNELQLEFKPLYEWAFGQKITHPETTARAESILAAVQRDVAFDVREPSGIPLPALRKLHTFNLLTLYTTAQQLREDETFYPCVFPKGTPPTRADPTNLSHAGFWCFDSGTPLNEKTWEAAGWSAGCAWDAAQAVKKHGYRLTYALSRPPGHHATPNLFGGYCYFNNAAIAARLLRTSGRVAIVDIDFHHGNGTQRVFYKDDKVLVVNLHGDPREFFPYFVGFAEETGAGKGEGFNLNLPLPAGTTGRKYLKSVKETVLPCLDAFGPDYLVISAGLDAYHKDPMGKFGLTTEDFNTVGELLGRLHLPTVAVQEGGYYTPHLGRNVVSLLQGIRAGHSKRRRVVRS